MYIRAYWLKTISKFLELLLERIQVRVNYPECRTVHMREIRIKIKDHQVVVLIEEGVRDRPLLINQKINLNY